MERRCLVLGCSSAMHVSMSPVHVCRRGARDDQRVQVVTISSVLLPHDLC